LGRQKNILFRKSADQATKYKISLETLNKIKESSTKLLNARAKRCKTKAGRF
jgi:hypothetical protein